MAEDSKDKMLQAAAPPSLRDAVRPSHTPTRSTGKKFNFSEIEEREYSPEEFKELARLYDNTFSSIHEGQIVKGKIVAITDNGVAIDIGFKSEGLVPLAEFPNIDELKPGDDVEVFLEAVENKDGQLVLSRKRADFMRTWERITKSYETGEVLTGKVTRRIKGGLVVDLMGLDAFLPGSQIDVKPVRDFDQFLGKTMEFRVAKINHPNENVVVSHKVLIEAEMQEQRSLILNSLEKGQVLEGTAKAITDFGVFVDLGGVDGLIHITDLSWGRVNHPSEVVKLDQTITVVVLDFDEAKKRISLGMKQLQPDPWMNLLEKYPVGSKHTGIVRNLTNFGVFVELEDGVDGLVHISDLSWTKKIRHPGEVVKKGDRLEVVILGVDVAQRRISLGHKQVRDNPWDAFAESYKSGTETAGKIVRIIEKGVIVELPSGVDGFVPLSHLAMSPVKNIADMFHVGDELTLKVIEFDKDSKRIVLSAVEYLKGKEQRIIDEYASKHKLPPMTLKDVANISGKAADAPPDAPGEQPPT